MRSRTLFVALAAVTASFAPACAQSSDDTGGLVVPAKKDAGADTATSAADDTGSPSTDDTGSWTPPADTGSTTTDTGSSTPPADTGPTGGTTGIACTSDAVCGSAGDHCTAFLSPVCAGMACTNPADSSSSSGYADYSPCDSDAGVCSPDTTKNDGSGYCAPKCSIPLHGGAATGCLTGDTCIPDLLDSSGSSAIGSCEGGACTSDAECAAASSTYAKCQKETMNCVQTTQTFGAAGAKCTVSTSGTSTPNCVCLAANPTSASTTGYCANLCITGDASHGCSSGYSCDPLLNTTYFTAIPTGIVGYCAKSCSTSSTCPTGTTCQSFGGPSVCAP